MAEPEQISDKLREALSQCGLSLNQVAEKTGIIQTTLWRFAAEKKDMRLSSANKLATFLGLELRETRSGAKKPVKPAVAKPSKPAKKAARKKKS